MEHKLFDSELKVMGVLWREGDVTAKHISDVLGKETGWNINTTYTIIKRCIKKGAVERREPNFLCHALIAKEEVQQAETDALVDRLFDGAADRLFASLLDRKRLSAGEIARLKEIVKELE
ncbi:MAG: BlaI/MecI/CopY family transcriptional regulator [Oscillospiraceae bacterium]|nr:BlaI/MecI/CopY family transcriptional regulator [Oscillospiraceae bacterium]